MRRYSLTLLSAILIARSAWALEPFPSSFHTQEILTNGTTLHVRIGGAGPAVVMLHGFGDTGDMWAPGASVLVKHRSRITKWVVIDAPIPGIGNWDQIKQSPLLWHFNFRGPDVERLVAGRERIYLDRFYNELSADPKKIDEATRRHYAALYARPHAMHDAFEQFGAFNQDAVDDQALLASGGKLAMPVLAVGAEKSFGSAEADTLRFVATNVTMGIVPDSGHWIMDENPKATTALIVNFLAK